MNTKRLLIALILGALAGVFCAYGTQMAGESGDLKFELTNAILASVFYNRFLIGIAIGFAAHIKLNSLLRGAIIGTIISISIGIFPMLDGNISGTLMTVAPGLVYGLIIDFVATKFGK